MHCNNLNTQVSTFTGNDIFKVYVFLHVLSLKVTILNLAMLAILATIRCVNLLLSFKINIAYLFVTDFDHPHSRSVCFVIVLKPEQHLRHEDVK
jgi:hypothetical protein